MFQMAAGVVLYISKPTNMAVNALYDAFTIEAVISAVSGYCRTAHIICYCSILSASNITQIQS
jgi:hypothetical protein